MVSKEKEKLKEDVGVLDGLPIRGGERTDIVIEDNYGNQLRFKDGLYVNRVRGADPGSQKEVFSIDFLHLKNILPNEQSRVLGRYEGKISEHVTKIITAMKGNLVKIDNTSLNYNFIGNDRKPFYTCTWLASKAFLIKMLVRGYDIFSFKQEMDSSLDLSIVSLMKMPLRNIF